jgi:hypothetical protein
MKLTLLLFLSADRLHAQKMVGKRIESQREFADTPEGLEEFSSFARTVNYPTFLLTDLIEEDFRHEIVPHLTGRSRASQLKRKFEQFYRATPFHQATVLQRQKTGRRDDDILFSALTNPSLIMPWLNTLLAHKVPLAGIYSVPQISAPLVKNHPSDHLLLISWERFSGLRQTYFSDHHLQISRLTAVHNELSFHDAVVKELGRTYQYLKSLSLLPSGQVLDVRILCHARDHQELANRLPVDENMRYDFPDIERLGRSLGIEHGFTDSDASQIFLYQLLASQPRTDYSSAEHTRYHKIRQLRLTLNWGAILLFLVSSLWGMASVWQSTASTNESDTLFHEAQRIDTEAQQIKRGLPMTRATAADMRTSVSVMRKLWQYGPSPQVVLVPISAALSRFTQIELNELDWQSSAGEPVASNTRGDVPAQVITIRGVMNGFDNDYRAALSYLDGFQAELGKRGYQVSALAKPVDVSPSGSLADRSKETGNPLGFTLKLVWRPPA